MKKFAYIFSTLLFIASSVFAQGELDALRNSRNDLYGTARAMAMGNAFGALGGDLTGVSINPAGIAVYRSSELVGTLSLNNEASKIGDISKNKFFGGMDNLGFVSYIPLRSNSVQLINFGFSYNRLKTFDKKYRAESSNNGASLTDYITHNFANVDPALLGNDNNIDPFYRSNGAPWLPILAYQSFLIFPVEKDGAKGYESILNPGDKVSNTIDVREKGSIDSYDFTVGTSINNVLNLGLALSVTSIDYSTTSVYSENFPSGNKEGFDIESDLNTSGAGIGLKLGMIYRPINSLRLGISYQSPTWYNLTDRYWATSEYKVDSYIQKLSEQNQNEYAGIKDKFLYTGEDYFDYSFQTPDKWTASVAGVFNNFILSMDYELTNYKSMKFTSESSTNEAYFNDIKKLIKSDYKPASSIRLGGEYRFTPQFSGRLGYAWVQNPYNETFSNNGDAVISGTSTITHFRMEGDTNYFTGGLGYRFNRSVFMDLAIVYKTQSDDFYPFPNISDESRNNIVLDAGTYNLKNNTVRGLLTIGYRF